MKEEWLMIEWPGYHLYQALPPAKAWVFDFPKFGCSLSKFSVTYSKGTTSYCFIKKEFEDNGKKLFESIQKKPKIMFKVLKKVDLAADKIFAIGEMWQDVNFIKLSDQELLDYHKILFYWDEILWRHGQIQNLLEFHNNFLSEYTRKLISKKYGREKVNEYFGVLSASRYDTMSERQDEDFLKLLFITKKLNRRGNKFKTLLARHAKKYRWMIYGWAGPALDERYFQDNLSAGLKDEATVNELQKKFTEKAKTLKRQEQLINNFAGMDEKLVLLLRSLLEAKAKRVDAHSLTYFLGDQIRGEIARRKYLSLNQIRVLSVEETQNIYSRPVGTDKLNARFDLAVYWHEQSRGLKELFGKAAAEKYEYIKSRLPKLKNANKITEIKGELAYIGKARGRVSIILSSDDFHKFRAGEILVTRVTDPNYVPLMKIAGAIVTDIGGITSHAAIVSRELGVPCIIGTKIATQVLRDGDLVEVDAEKGVVKKLP